MDENTVQMKNTVKMVQLKWKTYQKATTNRACFKTLELFPFMAAMNGKSRLKQNAVVYRGR